MRIDLLRLDTRQLDQLGPVRHLALDELAELRRIHRRDVGADELCRGEPERVQVDEHHHAERTGTNRGEGHQKTEQGAG